MKEYAVESISRSLDKQDYLFPFLVLVAIWGGAASGCATIVSEKVDTTQRIIQTRRSETMKGVAAEPSQADDVVILQLESLCHVTATDEVEVNDAYESKNNSVATTWGLAATGFAFAALGGYTIYDAQNVYPKDESSQNYNQYGPTSARALGIGTAALGAVLLGIAGVDVARAQASEVKTSRHWGAERTPSGTSCNNRPLLHSQVVLVFPDNRKLEGLTNERGQVRFDLSRVEPLKQPVGQTLARAFVGGEEVGSIDLKGIFARWAEVVNRQDSANAQASAAEGERARRDEAGKQLEDRARRLREIEAVIARMMPPWTEAKFLEIGRLLEPIEGLCQFSAGEAQDPGVADSCRKIDSWAKKNATSLKSASDAIVARKRRAAEAEAAAAAAHERSPEGRRELCEGRCAAGRHACCGFGDCHAMTDSSARTQMCEPPYQNCMAGCVR